MKRIYVILDYLGTFASRYTGNQGVDLKILEKYFLEKDCEAIYKRFYEINFREDTYKNAIVIYQSSEDTHDKYKSYVDDILLGLKLKGAILIPDYIYFKAHQDKLFMEILRDLNSNIQLKTITSKYYGTYEEYFQNINEHFNNEKEVFKPAWGSGSINIIKLSSNKEKTIIPKILSETREYKKLRQFFYAPIKSFYQKFKGIFIKKHTSNILLKESINREKFIIQNFISELFHDYKILVFGKKYYVLLRHNRQNDFRASGSGNFRWIDKPGSDLLDYAENVFKSFNTPYLSLDVAEKEGRFYLFEFQFIMFGTLTMEESEFYFQKIENNWEKKMEKPVLEREIVQSITDFLACKDLN